MQLTHDEKSEEKREGDVQQKKVSKTSKTRVTRWVR
jgi:hypothetical protein